MNNKTLFASISEYLEFEESPHDWISITQNETVRILRKTELQETFTREALDCKDVWVQKLTDYFKELTTFQESESYKRLAFAVHVSPDYTTFHFLVKEIVNLWWSFEQAFIEWANWDQLSQDFWEHESLKKFFEWKKPFFYAVTESDQDLVDSEIFSSTLYSEFKKITDPR